MFLNDLFNEAKRPVKQGSINDYPVPKKLHKGIDKIYARVLQRQVDRENGEHVPNVDEQVAVVVAAHPQLLSYGIFKRVGRSGKCHIKLLGGKLKDWAAGDMIAVEPSEVYATWDPSLQDKTAVHRAYNDAGQSTVREGPEENYAKDPSGHMRNMHTNRLEGPSGFDTSPSSEEYYRQRREAKRAKARDYRAKKKAAPAPVAEAELVRDRKTGQEYDPAAEFEKLQKDPDYIAQMTRMGREEGKGWPKRQDREVSDFQKRLDAGRKKRDKADSNRPSKEVKEATGLKKHVKIVKGPAAGKTGYVGEVHNGLYKGAPKQFVVDLDGGGNIKCSKDELRLIKDTPIEEARGLAPVSPYVDLLGGLAWFITAQTAKITQDAVDATAQQELTAMQQQFQKPILNGMTFAQVYDKPELYKNPKVAPVLLKFVYDMLGYIEPRIKKFIHPELQNKWLTELGKLKDKYRAAVTQVS